MTAPRQSFATTQWTLVWRAASDDSAHAKPAMELFIQRYWQPLYYFARQQGLSATDAEDATQEFLSQNLDGQLLSKADPIKGRFRSYLLTVWRRFLIDEFRKQSRQKAGGQLKRWSLDVATSETKWQQADFKHRPPDDAFTLAWANAVLEQVQTQLASDYRGRGRESLFKLLWPYLTKPIEASDYQLLATATAMSQSAVKVALHRLRQRYGETLRAIIGETVDDPSEIDGELSELIAALKRS